MHALIDFFSTDYVLSALVLATTIGMLVFYISYFMKHIRQDTEAAEQAARAGGGSLCLRPASGKASERRRVLEDLRRPVGRMREGEPAGMQQQPGRSLATASAHRVRRRRSGGRSTADAPAVGAIGAGSPARARAGRCLRSRRGPAPASGS